MLVLWALAGCAPETGVQVFQATVPPTQNNAPIYSPTPSLTPSPTPTTTPTPTLTPSPTITPTPSDTPTPTLTPTLTPSPTPTTPLLTLTPVTKVGLPPAFIHPTAALSASEGWSCKDFPCEDDIEGFQQRIRVPEGYTLSHVGRFPGQPMQIVYGPDGRLYATLLENGSREGAVYVMNPDGSSARYSARLVSPIGLAFQPGTDVLYVSARVTLTQGGGLWRVLSDGTTEPVITDLPCCFSSIDNQPNGIIFGTDGYLYMGIGALTDHGESPNPQTQKYADIHPLEAAILRINPHTGEVTAYAHGLRNPYDLALDSSGQLYASDNGLADGPGDRIVKIEAGGHYGWPYWRGRGCDEMCPPTDFSVNLKEDLLSLRDYSLPRGLVAYTGNQFPENVFDHLFVVLWNGTDYAQRVVRFDPKDWRLGREDYFLEPFVTGLIRPVDVTLAPDGALVIADFIYGHIWKVSYTRNNRTPAAPLLASPLPSPTPTQMSGISFVTSTPRP